MASSSILSALLSRQPFKGVYVLLAIALGLVRMPLWLIWYIPRSTRQSPKYSWNQAVRIEVVRSVLHHTSVVQAHTPLPLTPARELKADPSRFCLIQPAADGELYSRGVLAQVARVKPATISGVWYPKKPTAEELADTSRPLVLQFHGGAYVIGDARPSESGWAGELLSRHVGPSLHISYRLANTANPYPAQLQDAVTAYAYVVRTLKVPPSKVVLSGDSAGANLAIGLLRYLRRHRTLDTPAGALLWSPWVDAAGGADPRNLANHRAYPTDYLPPAFPVWAAKVLVPEDVPAAPSKASIAASLGESYAEVAKADATPSDSDQDDDGPLTLSTPYLCPKSAPFPTEAKLWAQAGELEVLYDDINEFAEGMRKVPGNNIELYIDPGSCHDIFLAGKLLGMEAESHRAGAVAGKWVRETLGLKTP